MIFGSLKETISLDEGFFKNFITSVKSRINPKPKKPPAAPIPRDQAEITMLKSELAKAKKIIQAVIDSYPDKKLASCTHFTSPEFSNQQEFLDNKRLKRYNFLSQDIWDYIPDLRTNDYMYEKYFKSIRPKFVKACNQALLSSNSVFKLTVDTEVDWDDSEFDLIYMGK